MIPTTREGTTMIRYANLADFRDQDDADLETFDAYNDGL